MLNQLAILLLLSWSFANDDAPYPETSSIHDRVQTHYNSNLDSAHILATQAVFKSKELGDNFGLAKSQFILGMVESKQGKTNFAVIHLLDALKNYASINNTAALSDKAKVCLAVGKLYRQHHRVNEAIEFYEKGMSFAQKANDQKIYVKLLHNMAIACRRAGQLTKAKDLLLLKLEITDNGDLTQKLFSYNQLGLLYRDLGENDLSRSYYKRIVELDTSVHPSLHRGQAFHNLANIYKTENDFSNAWKYFDKALLELSPLQKATDLIITYQDMANLALSQEKKELALSLAEKARPLVNHVPQTPEYYDQFLLLSRCYRDFDPEQSYKNTDLYANHNAAFLSLQKELIELGEGYKMDLITSTYFHEQRQHQQKMRLYWTIGCGFLFLLIAGLVSQKLWRIYRYKSPQASLELIKNQQEMIYLFDLLRKEKAEIKNTMGQQS